MAWWFCGFKISKYLQLIQNISKCLQIFQNISRNFHGNISNYNLHYGWTMDEVHHTWMKMDIHRWISFKMILIMILRMMLLVMLTSMLIIMSGCHQWHHFLFNKFHKDQPWACLGITNGSFSSFPWHLSVNIEKQTIQNLCNKNEKSTYKYLFGYIKIRNINYFINQKVLITHIYNITIIFLNHIFHMHLSRFSKNIREFGKKSFSRL